MALGAAVRGGLLVVSIFAGAGLAVGCATTAEVPVASEAQLAANARAIGAVADTPAPVVPAGSAKAAETSRAANVVGVNCAAGECEAACVAGSSILLAYGFHGRTYDSGGAMSDKCGERVEWLGGCIGQESCRVKTECKSSAMYLICR
ncbi:MAG: hypothetical protein R3B70_06615 [Polyangiaceae bacterium]